MKRLVMNDCKDIKNIAEFEDIRELVEHTTCDFIKYLRSINGPLSHYSLVLFTKLGNEGVMFATGSELDNRVFLKDGRYVLSNIECISPIQQYLKSIILYSGSRVDSACSDGTTTAMLLSCHILRHFYKERYKFKHITTLKFEQTVKEYMNLVLEELSKKVITKEDIVNDFGCTINEAAAAIAYTQAYTSSGGDYDIAHAVSEFFRLMPEQTWDSSIEYKIPESEMTGYRVKAKSEEYEVTLKGMFLTYHLNNYERNSSYYKEHTDLLILPRGITDASMETAALYEYLQNSEDTTPLFILVPGGNYLGNTVLDQLNAIAVNKKRHIAVGSYSINNDYGHPINWMVEVIAAKANKPMYELINEIDDCIIPNVTIYASGQYLYINNITVHDDRLPEDSNVHPGELYPEDYIKYTECKEFLNNYLTKLKNSHKKDPREIDDLSISLGALPVKKKISIHIGGLSYEKQAIKAVIEDATGAALSSVKHGVLFNSPTAVLKCMKDVQNSIVSKYSADEYKYNLLMNIHQVFDACIDYLNLDLFGTMEIDDCTAVDFLKMMNSVPVQSFCYTLESEESIHSVIRKTDMSYYDIMQFVNNPDRICLNKGISTYCFGTDIDLILNKKYTELNDKWKEHFPPVSTGNLYHEIFKRLNELIFKLIMTDNIIVPGTAWDNSEG